MKIFIIRKNGFREDHVGGFASMTVAANSEDEARRIAYSHAYRLNEPEETAKHFLDPEKSWVLQIDIPNKPQVISYDLVD